jgi:restriction endonuclease S subunit
MKATAPSLAKLKPNSVWATLPLFDRTGWKRMAFGEFAESIGERAEPKNAQDEIYVGLEHLDPQCLHIRRWGKGSDVIGGKLRFRKGDIIFGKRRAYQRKLAVAEFGGICSAHAMVIRARPDKVLPEFLPFLMMSDRFMNRAVEISVGSLSPTINWTTLKLESFDLPPLDQQRRIAEILWAVDEALSSWESSSAAAGELQVETLRDFFLTPGDEKSEIFLEDICEVQCGYAFKSTEYQQTGVPLIRISNVVEPRVDIEQNTVFLDARYLSERSDFIVRRGDLLVALTGDVGKTGLYDDEALSLLNQRVGRLRYRRDSKISEALFNQVFFLFRERMMRDAYGSAQANISPTKLKRYSIYLPSKIPEKELAEQINALVSCREACERHSGSVLAVRNAVMRVIFKPDNQ